MEFVDGRDQAPCDSCGADTPVSDLRPVRRVYFEDVENPEPVAQQEVELWCSGCRETYPNEEQQEKSREP